MFHPNHGISAAVVRRVEEWSSRGEQRVEHAVHGIVNRLEIGDAAIVIDRHVRHVHDAQPMRLNTARP